MKMPPVSIGLVVSTMVASVALSACGGSSTPQTTSTLPSQTVVHSWASLNSSNIASGHNVLMAVASAGKSIIAVGDYFNGSVDRTLIESKNSHGFVPMSSPNASTMHNELDAVAGLTSNDVWAVGRYAPLVGQERTLIEHFDGVKWSIIPSPNVGQFHNELDGISAVYFNDVWAVGHYDTQASPLDKALIEHWDGVKWSIVPAPSLLGKISDLKAISVTPKGGPVWAVGSQQIGNRVVSLAIQMVGGVWRVIPSPNHGPFANALTSVSAISVRVMWAVGAETHSSTSLAVTLHWDGQDIDLERIPERLTHHYELNSVAGDSLRRVFAVGDYYAGKTYVPIILQWTGKHWRESAFPTTLFTHNILLGVETSAGAVPVAVGKYFSGSADQTLAYQCRCK